MVTTLFQKRVKTRKDRQCFLCYRKFDKGAIMRFWKGIYEGQINATYNCETCSKIIDLENEHEFSEGHVKEMLTEKQTPEELLIELTPKTTEK